MVLYMKSTNSRPINKDQFYYYKYCPNSEVDTDEKWLYREIAKTLKFKIHNDFDAVEYISHKVKIQTFDKEEYNCLYINALCLVAFNYWHNDIVYAWCKKSIYLHPSGESSSFGVDDVGEYSNDFNYILDKYERLVNLDSSEYKNLSGYYLQYSFSEMKQLFNL